MENLKPRSHRIAPLAKSPHNLLQELYHPDGWKILVCCILLNQTTRKQVDKIHVEFFKRYPSPKDLLKCDIQSMKDLIKPLGFVNRRSDILLKMSLDYCSGTKDISEMRGIGKYATDAWKIFINGEIIPDVQDHALKTYVNWKVSQLCQCCDK